MSSQPFRVVKQTLKTGRVAWDRLWGRLRTRAREAFPGDQVASLRLMGQVLFSSSVQGDGSAPRHTQPGEPRILQPCWPAWAWYLEVVGDSQSPPGSQTAGVRLWNVAVPPRTGLGQTQPLVCPSRESFTVEGGIVNAPQSAQLTALLSGAGVVGRWVLVGGRSLSECLAQASHHNISSFLCLKFHAKMSELGAQMISD